ncbi:hypothetical protein EB796_007304 [Bugula neritina]|uniref:Thyroglobulin type-1 domain-containing protein n=1 Tax=Bugula neritina TaxID=10212 RepID=A0A7J7K832_BUGNE|nr:hypothetical protein EB796_007304 [Bugula neritina]
MKGPGVIVLVSIVAIYYVNTSVICPQHVCEIVSCESNLTEEVCDTRGGRFVENGGFCQCCDVCLLPVGEGGDCSASMTVPATVECTAPLYCDFYSRRCKWPSCATVKKEAEDYLNSQAIKPLGYFIPDCDANGGFKGKQCHEITCYCVDINGNKLPGYDHPIWTTDNTITCECARAKVSDSTLSCTAQGDYITTA